MTREEVARVLKYLWIERDENAKSMQQLTKSFFERQEALRIGVAVLRGSEPDSETGLVPCRCGGKAKIESGSIRCIRCDISVRCGYDDYINHHDDAKRFYEIREPWNRVMR